MRLCLEEHYSPAIARELRKRGHDACSVKERPELSGLSDRELWTRMQDERRALVIENVADFVPLAHDVALAGDDYRGLLFSSPRSLPRGAATVGTSVDVLDDLMRRHPGEDDFRDRNHWLSPSVS